MRPFMPSFPSAPNQVQVRGGNNSTPQPVGLLGPQMANSGNLGSGNLTNQFPCSCPHQMPSQSHAVRSQFPVPMMDGFSNQSICLSNLHGNGALMPDRPPPMPFTSFSNGATCNQPALQNGHVGMLLQNFNQMASMPGHVQFYNVPQNGGPIISSRPNGQFHSPQNLNQILQLPHGCLHPQNLNQNMQMQPSGPFCSHNLPQNLNQVASFPNVQFCLQNMIQNSNQCLPMCSQQAMVQTLAAPFNSHPSSHPSMPFPNQVPPLPGSQNSVPTMNSQFSSGNSITNPNSTVLSNEVTQLSSQGHKSLKNMQSSGLQQSQGNNIDSSGNNLLNANRGNPASKNFMGNKKGTNMRFQKTKMHHMANVKGHFKPAHGNQGKGKHSEGAEQSHLANPSKKAMGECQRYRPPNYSEEEIKQWREARRKNFPSKENIEKKLAGKLTNDHLIDNDAKIRRQQLREILAKQAEMGIEIAELPPDYLLEADDPASQKKLGNQGGRRDEKRFPNKRGRFQNQFDRRGNKRRQQNRWAKKPRTGGDASSPASISSKREPTLLQKLLSAEIERDKSHLLQVFRFMVLNKFFKDCPGKSLEFPSITVREAGVRDDIVKEKSLHDGGNLVSTDENIAAAEMRRQDFDHGVLDEDDCGEDDEDCISREQLTYDHAGKNCVEEDNEKSESEEGEITD